MEVGTIGDSHFGVLQYPRCAFLRVAATVTHLDLVTFLYQGKLS
jgi:hypothetical protein